MGFLKKYKFELALVAVLITVSAVLINVLATKKKEDDHGMVDGLRPAESYEHEEGDVPSDKFYEHKMMISKTDFEKYQITTVGGKTVKAVLPFWECFEGYERGEPEPTIKLSVSKAVESDTYKGEKATGYKYLSIYFAAENDYNLGYAWEITGNYQLTDHEDGEDYMHKDINYEKENRYFTNIGEQIIDVDQDTRGVITGNYQLTDHEDGEDYMHKDINYEKENRYFTNIGEQIIDVDQDTRGVITVTDGNEYAFSEPGEDTCIYMAPGDKITGKFVIKIEEDVLAAGRGVITVTDGNEYAFSEPGEDTCIYMAPGDKITGKFVIKIEEDVLAAGRNYVLYCSGSNRWMNMDFAVLIEQDKIEKAVNVE